MTSDIALATGLTREARIARLAWDPSACELEHVRTCNLCGGRRHVEVSRRDRYGYAFTLRACAGCGLGFLSPRLTAREYAGFYRDVYRPLVSAYHGRPINAETVQRDQAGYAADLLCFLEQVIERPPRTLMDVGGSTGVVARTVAERFGARATVLDPAPQELAVAERAGIETIEGFAEDYDRGERRFDLVLLCQTIDHLFDVDATLRAIRRMLADGGAAFVDLLDVLFVARREGSIEGAVKVDHPFYLTRATAEAFFLRAGLEVAAERMADDGHWGFVLVPSEPAEPDWHAMRAHAERWVDEIWRQRAEGS
jgi:SAM-dependent methyltransferase